MGLRTDSDLLSIVAPHGQGDVKVCVRVLRGASDFVGEDRVD